MRQNNKLKFSVSVSYIAHSKKPPAFRLIPQRFTNSISLNDYRKSLLIERLHWKFTRNILHSLFIRYVYNFLFIIRSLTKTFSFCTGFIFTSCHEILISMKFAIIPRFIIVTIPFIFNLMLVSHMEYEEKSEFFSLLPLKILLILKKAPPITCEL